MSRWRDEDGEFRQVIVTSYEEWQRTPKDAPYPRRAPLYEVIQKRSQWCSFGQSLIALAHLKLKPAA